jgi:uncharacterized membrane protein
MNDRQIQTTLARLMIGGVVVATVVIVAGLIWYLATHIGVAPGHHLFRGEPKYFENLAAMVRQALDFREVGERRSIVMIGIVLLLLNPFLRVAVAAVGFAAQRDWLYVGISAFVLAVLVFSLIG